MRSVEYHLALGAALLTLGMADVTPAAAEPEASLAQEVRRVLSENCFKCHGPDTKDRKSGKKALRLDSREGATADLGGHRAIVPGHPDQSELIRRITATDPEDRMPPRDSGKTLSAQEIKLLTRWIEQGATYARHWAYTQPTRPALPHLKRADWPRNAVDYFILARLEREHLAPSPEADRPTLIRRAALDLTGLPPTLQEVDRFVQDPGPNAYEKMVDRLLAQEAFGEHWARLWLDQARYADSSGYADDPPRTIWAYRDYVIRSLNANKPFDQFTLEQIAGDLLEDPTDEQLVATAFHRNTLTNNEGGTNDEEYRNVAVVDRVNTTMALWMGTTISCAQCHNHKYDPISQEDYFRLFALLNNTEDADRRDEGPLVPLYTSQRKVERQRLANEIAALQQVLQTATPALSEAQLQWEQSYAPELDWNRPKARAATTRSGTPLTQAVDGTFEAPRGATTDVYTVSFPVTAGTTLTAFQLATVPAIQKAGFGGGAGHADGNFILSRVVVSLTPPEGQRISGRYLRIEIPGKEKILSLAEVQAFGGGVNLALKGQAKQSSTAYDGPAKLAIDGNTDGNYERAKSTTHTEISANPWWELDLKSMVALERIVLWNRTDADTQERLKDFKVSLLNEKREPVWEQEVKTAPKPRTELALSGVRNIPLALAHADFSQPEFQAASLIERKDGKTAGWSVGTATDKPHFLTLIPTAPVPASAGSTLTIALEQLSAIEYATLARFRLALTLDPRASDFPSLGAPLVASLLTPRQKRTDAQRAELQRHFLATTPNLKPDRDRLAVLKNQLEEAKPFTTVPVLRELPSEKQRKTRIQLRGNWLDLGPEVSGGLPSEFQPAHSGAASNRLALARWLTGESNPLTGRVMANRLWEAIFGIGLVRTSEEFGAQGEPPSHPELLDWLATDLMRGGWDLKRLLRLLVTSATYRQSSRVTPELLAADPDNRLLARGPRFRLSAEMIRDQAMMVSGLLSHKMYGEPVKPRQPRLGLSAAFGGGTDWETSAGEDQFRRAIYTNWRRSNPYPSMATFDAPNREVCTVRRERSNTPLQALVTLNDPVYVEAAQALARRMVPAGPAPADKIRLGFRLCLARPPSERELADLVRLYDSTYPRLALEPAKAEKLATQPIGAAPAGADLVALASWTIVANVLLNLDEALMKR